MNQSREKLGEISVQEYRLFFSGKMVIYVTFYDLIVHDGSRVRYHFDIFRVLVKRIF